MNNNACQHGIATIAGLVQVSGSLPRLIFCHGGMSCPEIGLHKTKRKWKKKVNLF